MKTIWQGYSSKITSEKGKNERVIDPSLSPEYQAQPQVHRLVQRASGGVRVAPLSSFFATA